MDIIPSMNSPVHECMFRKLGQNQQKIFVKKLYLLSISNKTLHSQQTFIFSCYNYFLCSDIIPNCNLLVINFYAQKISVR